ncbi:MAG: hypothetical protein IJR96_02225 [Pseudobutyrivibrio sp.]|nr:hypothetical protein [Pseudobutyrivibrio sp.]
MKKFYLNTVLALMVAFTSFSLAGITAKADTFDNVHWNVVFNGKSIVSPDYDEINHDYKNAMPGDTIIYSVDYANTSGEAADFYMDAGVVKTLEEGSKATGGAYSYKIEATTSSEPLFISETLGGDAASENIDAIIGLDQVNNNEGAYFPLGTVAKDGKGTVTITVVLDGNSQTNSYMETLGTLDIKFGAQPTSAAHEGDKVENHNKIIKKIIEKIPGGTEVIIVDEDEITITGGNPQTGDSILPLIVCAVALIFGLLLIFWYFRMTRDNKEVA